MLLADRALLQGVLDSDLRRFERRSTLLQFSLVGSGLVFLLTMLAATLLGQSQEAINATLTGRIDLVTFRLNRLEGYTTAALVALIANFIAHVVQIRTQQLERRSRRARGD